MSKNSSSHDDVINRFIDYGENNFESNTITKVVSQSAAQLGVLRLIYAFRFSGHLRARLDPLGRPRHHSTPPFTLEEFGLSDADLDKTFDMGSYQGPNCNTLRDLFTSLNKIYCSSLGVEYMHISNIEERKWVQTKVETMSLNIQQDPEYKKWILQRLTAAEVFEKFLHNQYVGQKRFSLEGSDTLIPLLNVLIAHSGNHSIKRVCLGMAHRGRLNVLINILGKRAENLFKEFAGEIGLGKNQTGDVKYHQGFSSDVKTDKEDVHLALMFNPSHLELVNPVIEGYARYHQDKNEDSERQQILPVLIHGDAAFSGQGIVMETLNMSQSGGYRTLGTVHIIINNQIGFTTSKQDDARSTSYCTDVVKMINAPVFHVNAEDPEMVSFITRLALDYRMRYKKDVVIDLMCYRRHGHNEADEPAVTQPLMYELIRKMPTTRTNYAATLMKDGVLNQSEVDSMISDYRKELKAGERVAYNIIEPKNKRAWEMLWEDYFDASWEAPYESAITHNKIKKLNKKLQQVPDNFEVHPRVKKMMSDRQKMADGKINADWGFAETLAYASLTDFGTPIRLSGQDSGRGTFFHRNAVLHNQLVNEDYTPLQNISKKQGKVQIIDSILSEEAALGFEYGYATANPESLVIWEAQFGDFVNGAQAIIDQFIASGEAKWGRLSNLVMLLPHGLEGQGPEHSSARLERFLQLCASHNMQVCVPSTASQIFHLMRRQILRKFRAPLIIMSPKSLLRNPLAASPLHKFTEGRFRDVYEEQYDNIKPKKVDRIIMCSGKIFYELLTRRQDEQLNNVAILRLEQLYPFPEEQLMKELLKFPKVKDIVWCQEEPINQGAWYTSRHNFMESIAKGQTLHVVARDLYAAPAEGSIRQHNINQSYIIEKALGIQTMSTSRSIKK
ncbi:MAG: 2-oxoglutarate dehydrogenase E1 component [Candidatus Thioglobus sp.]|nr:2-oxoglutarate dehydrogenase E1 component [Candidatus Pseudothioglobus aerophilus]